MTSERLSPKEVELSVRQQQPPKKKIVVIGGGIAGLTVAHELSAYENLEIEVYEQGTELGGMARSSMQTLCSTEGDHLIVPTEVSWRGYAPFYANLFDLIKQIPIQTSAAAVNRCRTVYDNLSDIIEFWLPRNELETNVQKNSSMQLWDYVVLAYYLLPVLCANKRQAEYKRQDFTDRVADKLTQRGRDNVIEMLGPGLGLDKHRASMYQIGKYVELMLEQHWHKHTREDGSTWYNANGIPLLDWRRKISESGWQVMRYPTNVAWIEPWQKHLLQKDNVTIQCNTELKTILLTGDDVSPRQIKSVGLYDRTGYREIEADAYVLATNPYSLKSVLVQNDQLFTVPELRLAYECAREDAHKQVSFRLIFDKAIQLPYSNIVFSLPDSRLNITLYDQKRFFNDDLELNDNIRSLWSGTACNLDLYCPSHNKYAYNLTLEELKSVILQDLYSNESLNHLVKKYNGKPLDQMGAVAMEVWEEWTHEDGELVQTPGKWVTTLQNHDSRPPQKTSLPI